VASITIPGRRSVRPVKKYRRNFVKGVDQNFSLYFYFVLFFTNKTSATKGKKPKRGRVGKLEFENGGELEPESGEGGVATDFNFRFGG